MPPCNLSRLPVALFVCAVGCAGQIAEEDAPSSGPGMRPAVSGARSGEGMDKAVSMPGPLAPGAAAMPPPGGTGLPASMPPAPGAMPDISRPAVPLADFQCAAAPEKGATPRRLWRLRGNQYKNALAVFFRGRSVVGKADQLPNGIVAPFDFVNESDRFTTTAASYTMADYELRRLMNYSGDTAAMLVTQLRADPKSCLGAAARPPFAECVRSLVTERGPFLFSRPLSAAEIAQYTDAAVAQAGLLGEDDAVALAFAGLLSSPSFLYRTEVGQGVPVNGQIRLSPYEIAAALSYSMTDWPPTTALYQAAANGALSTPDEIAAQVKLLLGPAGKANSAVARFVTELFGYHALGNIFKNNKDIDAGNRSILLWDMDTLVTDLAGSAVAKDFWKTILTTTTTYTHAQTFSIYGTPHPNRYEPTRGTLPAAERAGLLTQPAWLASISDDTTTHPVQRGKFVNEALLCRPLPPLPIDVVPVLPDGAKMTMREKLAIHSKDPSCAGCHKFMDPIGLIFEAYDQNGRLRTTDNGKPVDATGSLSGAGAQDGPVAGPVDLANRLAASPTVEQCMVRQSFRYWMGRDEAPWDGCVLVEAQKAYANGGNYLDLLASLFSSRSFVYRSVQ